nr:hypothetical protein [Kiritimatiellia bacterium]
MDSIPPPDALLPLGLFMALLLVAGIAALGHFAWQVHPSREAWPERLRRLADASPWRWRDLGWILLLTAAAQTLRRFFLPNTPVWHIAAFQGVLCVAILWRMHGKVRPFGVRLPWRTAAGQALLRWLA